MQVEYDENFTVTVQIIESMRLGHHILETWRSTEHGGIGRYGDLPPIVAYDAVSGRCIYRAWPNRDGELRPRPNGLPSEIFDTEYEPHMKWCDEDGAPEFIARPSKVHRDADSNQILSFDYSESEVKHCRVVGDLRPLPSLDFSY